MLAHQRWQLPLQPEDHHHWESRSSEADQTTRRTACCSDGPLVQRHVHSQQIPWFLQHPSAQVLRSTLVIDKIWLVCPSLSCNAPPNLCTQVRLLMMFHKNNMNEIDQSVCGFAERTSSTAQVLKQLGDSNFKKWPLIRAEPKDIRILVSL